MIDFITAQLWLALSVNVRVTLVVLAALAVYAYVMVHIVRTMADVSDWYEEYTLDMRYVAILAEVAHREELRLERKEQRPVTEWWEQAAFALDHDNRTEVDGQPDQAA